MDKPEATRCPLCNAENHCAISAGESLQSCWCQTAVVAPEALASLPEAERGVRCICPACARGPEGAKE